MKKYAKLLRVKHYIKNTIIIMPLFFSGKLGNKKLFLTSVLGFIIFSLLSSIIYIINDINDVENDRKHSVKCKRPIASGEVSIRQAICCAVLLGLILIIINVVYFQSNFVGWIILLSYFCINIAYSNGLKKIPIVDVALLASGFLIRLLYGASITDIEISKWLYLTVIAMAFYFGLGKRRNELKKQSGGSRDVLKFYTYEFLDKNMYMCLTLAIAFYSLWSIDSFTIMRVGNSHLIWTVPLVIIICMKYNLIVDGESEGDPVEVILNDKLLILLLLLFIIMSSILIYI